MAAPTADAEPRGAAAAPAEQGETKVGHLVEMEDAFQADHQGKDAGQQAPLQGAVVVGEALPSGRQPAHGLGQEQEGTRILRAPEEKGGAGSGTGALGKAAVAAAILASGRDGSAAADAAAADSVHEALAAASRLARSRPYFLRYLDKATFETRTPKIR